MNYTDYAYINQTLDKYENIIESTRKYENKNSVFYISGLCTDFFGLGFNFRVKWFMSLCPYFYFFRVKLNMGLCPYTQIF